MDILSSVIAGTISGVISGLLVAGTLRLIAARQVDDFTFIHVGQGRAVLDYRGRLPIVIGGSFAFCEGPILTTAEGSRAAQSGIVVEPRTKTVFNTGNIQPGTEFSFTYKPIRPLNFKRLYRAGELYQWECDVTEFEAEEKAKEGWRLASGVLISAT